MAALKYWRLGLIARIAGSTAKANGFPRTSESIGKIRELIGRRRRFSEETHTGQMRHKLEGAGAILEEEFSGCEHKILRAIETCRSWDNNEFRVIAYEARQRNGAMHEDIGCHLQSEVPLARIDEKIGVNVEIIPQDKFSWLKKREGIGKTLGRCFHIVLFVGMTGMIAGAYSLRDVLVTVGAMIGITVIERAVRKKLGEFPTFRPAEEILGLIRNARDTIREDMELMKRIIEGEGTQPEKSTGEVEREST